MAEGEPKHRLAQVAEGICLAMACLAPWAFGAVDAWAELALECGIVLLAVIGLIRAALGDPGLARRRSIALAPTLTLAALAVMAWAQTVPLSEAMLRRVAPATAALRDALVPQSPTGVRGDSGRAVAPPASTVSLDSDATRHSAARLAAALILFQAVLGLEWGAAPLRRLAGATAVNAALMALFALVQALTWNGKIYGIRPSVIDNPWMTGGPFVGHSHLAAYLNLGLACALGRLLAPVRADAGRRGGRRIWGQGYPLWAAYAAGMCVVGIIASHSRSGFLAMLALLATVAILYRPGVVQALAGLAVMLVLVPLFLVAVGSASPFQRIASMTDSDVVGGLNGRVEVWKGTLEAWRDHPVWGMGLGSFATSAGPYFHHDHHVFYSHAENEYLQVLAEGGVVGLALGLAFWVGIGVLALRALGATSSRRDRALIVGAIAGLAALGVQSLGDFALHIPAVAVTVVLLAAHLCRLGLEARVEAAKSASQPAAVPSRRLVPVLTYVGLLGLGLVVVAGSGVSRARAEALVVGAGIARPGVQLPPPEPAGESKPALDRMRVALEQAIRQRPDWAEGHFRRALTLFALYRKTAQEWLADSAPGDDKVENLSDPLWLHAIIHNTPADQLADVGGPLEHEPVRDYLVPATRSLLEARRCCPTLPSVHARLATVDYLVDPAEPISDHVGRALVVAGANAPALGLAAQAAVQAGDIEAAVGCWRLLLEVRPDRWDYVADAAKSVLSPEQILKAVLPTQTREVILFADRLYYEPSSDAARTLFLRAARERVARDPAVTPEERPWLEAQILARLGERDRAREAMEKVLRRNPYRPAWREEYVGWLLRWGDPASAHRQALLGVQLEPGNPRLEAALKSAREALAAGPQARAEPARSAP